MKKNISTLHHAWHFSFSIFFLILICGIIIVLAGKKITDESVVSMQGDMPRYVMNGVYFYDLLKDCSITIKPLEHAARYFARYPALSLGHHPLFLAIAEVPFYALFGISIFSARATVLFFLLLAAISWFALIKTIYDDLIALLSTALFVTTPFIISYTQIVMSEIPTLSLMILSAYIFHQYCQTEKKQYLIVFVITVTCSIYAKHVAIFMFPVFFMYYLVKKGTRKLFSKEVILAGFFIFILLLPLVFITLKFSQFNVAGVVNKSTRVSRFFSPNVLYHIKAIWTYHLTLPLAVLSVISTCGSLYRRDKRIVLFLLWIAGCYLLMTYLGSTRARDSIYWIPAFSLLATASITFFQYRFWKILTSIVLITIVGYQFVGAYSIEPEYVDGYEDIAKYVVENRKGESVLYQEIKDTGYFIFFVRKHDPKQDLIVLRSDKILATSKMYGIVKERINSREQIYEILQKYGVGYVVIEDKNSGSRSLEWLREEVKTHNFILRKTLLLRSSYRDVNNVPLAIYEYKNYTPPKEGVILDMEIPLMGDSIQIPFKELL